MNRCETCAHARPMPDNLQQRICRGNVPQVVTIPIAGGVQIRHHFPIVLAKDEACGQYKSKNIIDHTTGELVE